MTGVILAYLFYFVVSTIAPLQLRWLKRGHQGGSEIAFSFWVVFILSVLGLAVFPFIEPLQISGGAWSLLGLSILCAVFGALYFIASFTAQKHVEAGVTSLALNIYTPITIVLSTLFFDESLKPLQIAGTALLLLSLYFLSKKHRTGTFRFDKYFLMMLGSGILLGLLLVAERALQRTTGFSGGTLLSWWSQCAGLGVAMLIFKSKNIHSVKETFITGILRFLQGFAYVFLVFVVGNLSVVSAVTTFKMVVVFVAAAIFLKEREDLPRKILGSVIAVAGLLLMR